MLEEYNMIPKHENEGRDLIKNRNKLRDEAAQLLNAQVSHEMWASLVYMAMGSHFNSEAHDRPGFAKFFRKNAEEEREHAMKISDYLNKRGTHITGLNIKMPDTYNWETGLQALQEAIKMENKVTDLLIDIHKVATDSGDGALTDFLESEFLDEQIESIRMLQRYINTLELMVNTHKSRHDNKQGMMAEYLFDLQLQGKEC
uniref:Ferritin n=1 Tax=Strigamia maritima TaxID=126957 RepID=T1J101_STRMM